MGLGSTAITRLVRSGGCERITRGGYQVRDSQTTRRPNQRELDHLCLLRVVLAQEPRGVATHHSGLVVHGAPAPNAGWGRAHIGFKRSWTSHRNEVVRHLLPQGCGSELLHGLRVVDLATALGQFACLAPLASAVAAMDFATHSEMTNPAQMQSALKGLAGYRGVVRARAAVEFIDPRSESVGESLLRMTVVGLGYDPASQVEIRDAFGAVFPRVDLSLDDVVLEFDGLVKYRGDGGSDAVVAEKIREDRLRALGLTVLRFTWRDLRDPQQIAARLRRALGG